VSANRPGSSRRVGAAAAMTGVAAAAPRLATGGAIWFLRLTGLAFAWPLMIRLLGGDVVAAASLLGTIAAFWFAGTLVGRGLATEAELGRRTLAAAPKLPAKLTGSLLAAAGAFLASFGGSHDSLLMGVLFGGLAFLGCRLAFGSDPKTDRDAIAAAAKRAGVTPEHVLQALEEAHRKVREIEVASAALASRELRGRLDRIVGRAREVLTELERDPRDLSRARRFLVTYLDGTRDVITKYTQQQHEVDEPLAANFARVLDTVEQVFVEQREVLRRDDALDLEVKIEVLETQLKREGVH
jgi:hypothetical protein